MKEYLDNIKPYLRDVIINLQKSDSWKVPSTNAINFISAKDDDEEHVMHLKSNNIYHMIMQIKFLMNFLSHVFQNTKLAWKHQ